MATREAPPPPLIAKAGRYTVFITPPATPRPPEASRFQNPNPRSKFSPNEKMRSNLSPKVVEKSPLPPVQVPPPQFEKGKGGKKSEGSVFGFFWGALAKVQDAHSSLDRYLADWLGLDQSRYQWALDDYYENKGASAKCHCVFSIFCILTKLFFQLYPTSLFGLIVFLLWVRMVVSQKNLSAEDKLCDMFNVQLVPPNF